MELVGFGIFMVGLYCIARGIGGFLEGASNNYFARKVAEVRWERTRKRCNQAHHSGTTTTWTYEDVGDWLDRVKARLDEVGLQMVGISSSLDPFDGHVTWAVWAGDPDSTVDELYLLLDGAEREAGGVPEAA